MLRRQPALVAGGLFRTGYVDAIRGPPLEPGKGGAHRMTAGTCSRRFSGSGSRRRGRWAMQAARRGTEHLPLPPRHLLLRFIGGAGAKHVCCACAGQEIWPCREVVFPPTLGVPQCPLACNTAAEQTRSAYAERGNHFTGRAPPPARGRRLPGDAGAAFRSLPALRTGKAQACAEQIRPPAAACWRGAQWEGVWARRAFPDQHAGAGNHVKAMPRNDRLYPVPEDGCRSPAVRSLRRSAKCRTTA